MVSAILWDWSALRAAAQRPHPGDTRWRRDVIGRDGIILADVHRCRPTPRYHGVVWWSGACSCQGDNMNWTGMGATSVASSTHFPDGNERGSLMRIPGTQSRQA